MVQSDSEADVQRWLTATGVESLCQWDVIDFLNRHHTVLMAPNDVARLTCYRTATILATLDSLAARELVRLSRESTGARLYEPRMPSDASRQEALERLLALGDHRAGRLVLYNRLARGNRSPRQELGAAPAISGDANGDAGIARHHSQAMRRTIEARSLRREPGGTRVIGRAHWLSESAQQIRTAALAARRRAVALSGRAAALCNRSLSITASRIRR